MDIIQSFWSKPAFHENQNFKNNRKFGGWLEYKYFLMSNCLSFLTLNKYHSKVKLYTDSKGYDIFINQLGLPYHDVSLVLDELKNEDHRLWVLGKLKTIALQEKPFIHVDNDIYIWDALPVKNETDYLIAQSKHPVPKTYQDSLLEVNKHFVNVPKQLKKNVFEYENIVNIGLLGGNDISFFQNYCTKAYSFLEVNKSNLEKINIGSFNQILDEFFISCLLNERKNVCYYIDSSKESVAYDSVLRFHLVPIIDKYIHLVGFAKQNKFACQQLELRLKYEFPDAHKKVISVLQSSGLAENMDAYDSLKENRTYKAIKKLYTSELGDIKNTKIQLYDNFKLKIKKNESELNEDSYILIEKNPFSKKEIQTNLKNRDKLLFYFEEPTSINEVIENIGNDMEGLSFKEQMDIEENILDIIFEKIILLGILEFK
tara:strand:+ start:99402 stop:100688 length:1287 start_codon:yes stop_codon:yes gene_type:complete